MDNDKNFIMIAFGEMQYWPVLLELANKIMQKEKKNNFTRLKALSSIFTWVGLNL